MLVLSMQAFTQHYTRWNSVYAGTPGSWVSVGQQGRRFAWAWTLTQLGGHRAQAARNKPGPAFPSQPCLVPWHGRGQEGQGGEERPPSGLRPRFCSVHGSVMGPLPRPHTHTPLRAGQMFCFRSHRGTLAAGAALPALGLHHRDSSQVLGRGWGTHVARAKDAGVRIRGHPWA